VNFTDCNCHTTHYAAKDWTKWKTPFPVVPLLFYLFVFMGTCLSSYQVTANVSHNATIYLLYYNQNSNTFAQSLKLITLISNLVLWPSTTVKKESFKQ
jgi:hypothetical protein